MRGRWGGAKGIGNPDLGLTGNPIYLSHTVDYPMTSLLYCSDYIILYIYNEE